jgi:type I restriction enzyme S subunit
LADVEATETATTVIHLGKGDIDRFRVSVPPRAVVDAFNAISNPLYARLVRSKQEVRTLSILRDALLPRLLSGELRVGDGERALEAVSA